MIDNNFFGMLELQLPFLKELLCAYRKDISRYKRVYLLGAGKGGRMVADSLVEIIPTHEVYFVDSNPAKRNSLICNGVKCISWNDILGGVDSIAILTSIKNTKDMIVNCGAYGVRIDVDYVRLLTQYEYSEKTLKHRSEYLAVNEILSDDESRRIIYRVLQNRVSTYENLSADMYSDAQYFREEFRRYMSDDEVLLDCGAYTGDTIECFKRYVGASGFKAIYAFEMDSSNYQKLVNNSEANADNIHLFNCGVGRKTENVKYTKNYESSSYVRDVSDENYEIGEIVNYDFFSKSEPEIIFDPTIVKMDIEGAEMDALLGMEKTIVRCRPKLFISIYHLQDDLWSIPMYLNRILPDYRFYIRHHTLFHADTVLYGFDTLRKA